MIIVKLEQKNKKVIIVRRLRNVKIVATLGPSSNDYNTIKALFENGADVFRLNMSHGTHQEIKHKH